MYDGNSDKVAGRLVSISAGETKALTVKFRTNLPQGSYFVGVSLFTPDEGFHLYEDEAVEFHVAAPKTLGNAFVDTQWDLSDSFVEQRK
jgi:hypothetical protein